MEALWILVKFITANILLIIVSSTLIGFIIRGILQPRMQNNYGCHKAEYYTISPTKGIVISLSSTFISIFLFILLYRYANIFIVMGFISWMLTRIKDLVREIKTGVKTTNRTMTKDSVDFILTATSWIGFFAFNYGLYLLWVK